MLKIWSPFFRHGKSNVFHGNLYWHEMTNLVTEHGTFLAKKKAKADLRCSQPKLAILSKYELPWETFDLTCFKNRRQICSGVLNFFFIFLKLSFLVLAHLSNGHALAAGLVIWMQQPHPMSLRQGNVSPAPIRNRDHVWASELGRPIRDSDPMGCCRSVALLWFLYFVFVFFFPLWFFFVFSLFWFFILPLLYNVFFISLLYF